MQKTSLQYLRHMKFYLHLANRILAWNRTKFAPLKSHYPKLQFPTYVCFSHAQSKKYYKKNSFEAIAAEGLVPNVSVCIMHITTLAKFLKSVQEWWNNTVKSSFANCSFFSDRTQKFRTDVSSRGNFPAAVSFSPVHWRFHYWDYVSFTPTVHLHYIRSNGDTINAWGCVV